VAQSSDTCISSDDEQQVFDEEEDVQQQLRADTVAEMDAAMSSFLIPSSLFGHFGLACQTIFTAMLATFLGLCALLRSRSNSKGGQSGATRTTIHYGGSSSSRMYALLRSYRYSVASRPLLFLVVTLAFIVPAAEAMTCREEESCGPCNANCPEGEFRVCRNPGSCIFSVKE
jgi:hypothetical protein